MNKTDLWIWSLTPGEDRLAALRSLLSDDEQARAARFRRASDRVHFEAAHGRLREILSLYCDRPPDALHFETCENRKPFLPGGPEFNLSHAAGWAALVIDDEPVGVDIERFRTVEPGIAERFFSPAEVAALDALPLEEREGGFFRCWTRKEAFVKAIGTGLTIPLESFDVSLSPEPFPTRVTIRLPEMAAQNWMITPFELATDFPGAIATLGARRLRLRETRLPLS
ncbi:4'-phosphopantetheinyl transferase family protein [Aliiruegeria sabulilitoris]|uniref:4'-phosphopantetheinyl transferase family protein n=1 Tax=Aliiruegeria sabulilitoris TaxID=1510458 RepID=UPI0008364660|nr:4'-phosphopantetheinyl transferase superfamily protein [Aliiruegeria sabulilitoris]